MKTQQAKVIHGAINPDKEALGRVEHIARLPGVEKVVLFSDLHQGEQETPVSIAVAFEETIYPQLSSNVINCGMSLSRTDLRKTDLQPDVLQKLAERLSPSGCALHGAAYKPTRDDIESMLRRGAEYVVEKWNLSPDVLRHIENGGNMFAHNAPAYSVREIVPSWVLGRESLHRNLPLPSLASNHFIEFQIVDEVIDKRIAEEWGIVKGQIVVFMHGDYPFTSVLNWHYANRLRLRGQSFGVRSKYHMSRALFHLLHGNAAGILRHGRGGLFTGFKLSSESGKRLVDAMYMAMNYAYANRLLTMLYLRDMLGALVGRTIDTELVWDVAHDSIQEEDGQWIARKGVGKVVSGKPVLVAGSYNMNSFLGRGLSSAREHLYSYDHGCSRVIEHYRSQGGLTKREAYTARYNVMSGMYRDDVQHLDDKPIRSVVENLSKNKILEPVAWLRPIVNFKQIK